MGPFVRPRRRLLSRHLTGAVTLAFALALGSCSDSSGTGDSGPPAEMEILAGNGQQGTVGQELDDALVVEVTDDAGKPVKNQLINWRVTAGGGSLFAGSSITDNDGVARERWTLGTVAGAAQAVEARAVDNATGAPIVFATFTAIAEAGPVAALVAVTSGTQEGPAGQALASPMVVRAEDEYDNPVEGVTIEWQATAGGGAPNPATSVTDDDGEARTTWTLGTAAGAQTLTARAGSLAPATFAATARAGGAARLEIVSGNEHDGTVGAPLGEGLVVRALDALGNAVSDAPVAWSVRTGGGAVAPVAPATNSAGVAQATWRLGSGAGTQTVAARLENGAEVVFTAHAKAGAVASLARVAGHGQRAKVGTALPVQLAVLATDQYGNVVPQTDIAWNVTADAGTVTPSPARTGDDGIARATWTLGAKSGNVAATASANGKAAEFAAYAEPAGASRLELVQASGGMVAERVSQPFIVRATDSWGTSVPGVTVSFAASHGGSFSPATVVTGADGRASSTLTLGTVAGSQRTTITADGVEPLHVDLLATAGPPTSVEIVSGDGQTGPVAQELPLPLVVRARDAYGNITGAGGASWSVVEGGGTLSPVTCSIQTGECSVRWRVGVAGPGNRVRANIGTSSEVFFRATATAVGARTLIVDQPLESESPVYTTWSPRVRLVDENGAPVAGAPVQWSITQINTMGYTAALVSSSNTTDADGYASALWRIHGSVGANTLTVTVAEMAPVTFVVHGRARAACFTRALTVGPFDSGKPVRINELLTGIRGQARDQFGNPVSGYSVRAPGGTIGDLTTDETGYTPVRQWSVGTVAGERIINYQGTECGGPSIEWPILRGVNMSFTVKVLPDLPATMFAWQGDGMQVAVGTKFIVRVMVHDQYGNRVPNVAVTWTVESGGGGLYSATSTTSGGTEHFNQGRSEHANYGSAYNEWTLGPQVGEQRIRATTADGLSFTFTATARAAP